jgi:hypothetical protein
VSKTVKLLSVSSAQTQHFNFEDSDEESKEIGVRKNLVPNIFKTCSAKFFASRLSLTNASLKPGKYIRNIHFCIPLPPALISTELQLKNNACSM